MFNTLYGKLVAVLLGFAVVMVTTFFLVIRYSDTMRRQEVNQKLYRTLARQLVNEHIVPEQDHLDLGAIEQVFNRIRTINPRIDVYLLDEAGRVLASSGKTGVLKRTHVDLEAIRRFLKEGAELPILGDDPGETATQRVFSVAPISIKGRVDGYLYLVLRGLSGDDLAQQIKSSYFLRESLWLTAGGLILALLAGTLIIRLITRPLQRLTVVMDKFRRSGFAEPPIQPAPRHTANGDEIGHLTDTFNQMADRLLAQMEELKRTDAMRRELIANISHDLRTPLATLQGYLETLQFKGARLAAEQKSTYLAVALKQSEQLSKLVSKLFELAKLDSEKVTILPEPFVLEDLVQDVVQEFELAASNKGIGIECDLPDELPLVRADIGLIERVLRNLIENSMCYTPAGGRIRISLTPEKQRVTVQVSDTGHGIDAKDLPRIFDRFYRGEKSRTDSSGNAGLGLAIAKRILELHDSSIAVSSAPGQMTTFSFALPYASHAAPGAGAEADDAQAAGRLLPAQGAAVAEPLSAALKSGDAAV